MLKSKDIYLVYEKRIGPCYIAAAHPKQQFPGLFVGLTRLLNLKLHNAYLQYTIREGIAGNVMPQLNTLFKRSPNSIST